MNSLYPIEWMKYLDVLCVFLRMLGLFMLVPAFSHKAIPVPVKTAMAFALSLALYPVVRKYLEPVPMTIHGMALYALRETVIGFLMGLSAYLTFEAIHLAAHFIGSQIGLGSAAMMDPQHEHQVTVLVPLHGWLALMIFFFCDMHHSILTIFTVSFELTRSMSAEIFTSPQLLKYFVGLSGKLFLVTVQMAAPFTLLILACNAAMGVLARLMPQLNVLLFSFPITLLLGFSAMYLLAPDMLAYVEDRLVGMSDELMVLVRIL